MSENILDRLISKVRLKKQGNNASNVMPDNVKYFSKPFIENRLCSKFTKTMYDFFSSQYMI